MRPLLVPLALCGTLALAACGVKGPLEPPPGAQAASPAATPATKPAQQQTASTAKGGGKTGAAGTKGADDGTYIAPASDGEILESATPHAEWQKKKSPPGATTGESPLLKGVNRPDQPFILDSLL